MGSTSIEWTDASWNPVRGCTKVSPGCKNCYAEAFAERFRGVPGHPYERGFDLRYVPEHLEDPTRWRKPRRIFVNSMSDLFHEDVHDWQIVNVFCVMEGSARHTYQVLTKRAERMRAFVNDWAAKIDYMRDTPESRGYDARYKQVWLGVSVEDRKHGLPRVDELRETRASVRFLSIEPLLEDLGALNLRGIHWVIVGGESGHGARPFELGWARSIRDQCREAGVAFFFKQAGLRAFDGDTPITLRSRKGGAIEELPPDLRLREFPEVAP